MTAILVSDSSQAQVPAIIEEMISPLDTLEKEDDLRIAIISGDASVSIADRFKMSVEDVDKHIKRYRKNWLSNFENISKEEEKAESLARVEYLYSEYFQAWKRSQKGVTMTRVGGGIEMTQTVSNPGDDKYLKGMAWCIEKKLQLRDVVSAGSLPTALPQQNFNVNMVTQIAQNIPEFKPLSAQEIASQTVDISSKKVS